MKKCICQVCCCGRHRCPHNLGQRNRVINKSEGNKCEVTEYRGKFDEITPKRGPFRRPRDLIVQEGKVEQETTTATSFIPHSVQPPKPREPEKFVPNPHRFDTISEHHAHYKELNGIAAKMPPYLKTTTMRKPSAKLTYLSTKQDDFKPWIAHNRPEIITREKGYRPPSKPFRETSIHRQDYTRFHQAPHPTARQPDKLTFGEAHGDFVTTTMSYHKPMKIEMVQPAMTSRSRDQRSPPKTAFTSQSVSKNDFIEHRAAKSAQIYKPESNLFKTDQLMASETTKATSYKAWPVEARYRKTDEIYQKPEGVIELKATSSDYLNHGEQGIPAKSARPRTKLQRGREFPFNPTTSYSLEFKTHNSLPSRRENLRNSTQNANEIFPRTDNDVMNGTSEFLDKYKRHQAAPARMYKGDSSLFKTTSKMGNATLYNEQFRGEKITCPSENILRGAFTLDHVNEEGHQIYDVSPRANEVMRREVTVA